VRARHIVLALGAVVVLGGALAAQGRFRSFEPVDEESLIHNVKYDGRFTFARARYVTGPGGYYYGGLPAWAHGYPRAEHDLMQILNEVSDVDPHIEENNVIALNDPELFKYPIVYMTEGGFWTLSDSEAVSFRAYLLKGGFAIFDDFREDGFRGGGGWAHFEANMKRVLPDARWIDLDPSMPVYHSFFEIPSFDVVRQYYDRGRPAFRGLFEDNDPTKRLMVVANFNTDVSNFWEFSATGEVPVSESNEAYKLGVDYVIYGMTH
jgi:hypothetical protein